MNLDSLLVIAVSTIFINNYVLSRFLGLCPFLGVSRSRSSATDRFSAWLRRSLASAFMPVGR